MRTSWRSTGRFSNCSFSQQKESFEGQLGLLKAQESEVKGDYDRKLDLAQQYAAKIKSAYPDDVKRFAEAQKEIVAIEQAKNQQIQALREQAATVLQGMALSEVDSQQRAAELSEQLGQITYAQLLAKEREFEDARNQIQLSSLQEKFAIYAQDPFSNVEKLAATNAQIEALELQHLQRLQEIQAKSAIETNKHWTDTYRAMNSGFTSVIGNFLKGTQTFAGFVRGMFGTVLDAITNTLAQIAAQWLTTAVAQLISGQNTSAGIISGHAGEAGAAAVAATAAIPIVGPALAPAAGILASQQAMAFQGLAAAEQGFDVPGGVNPVTRLHQREMVLPAKYADVIRGLESGGGGSAGHTTVNLNISTHDAGSFAKSLNDNSSDVAKALKKHLRETGRVSAFVLMPPKRHRPAISAQ